MGKLNTILFPVGSYSAQEIQMATILVGHYILEPVENHEAWEGTGLKGVGRGFGVKYC